MENHHIEIINLALDKMLNRGSHFSICTIDKLAKAIGTNCALHPDYRYLSNLHCVNYSEMSPDLIDRLPGMIMSVLSARFDTSVMAKALAAVHNGEIKDLPNIEDDCPTRVVRLFKR